MLGCSQKALESQGEHLNKRMPAREAMLSLRPPFQQQISCPGESWEGTKKGLSPRFMRLIGQGSRSMASLPLCSGRPIFQNITVVFISPSLLSFLPVSSPLLPPPLFASLPPIPILVTELRAFLMPNKLSASELYLQNLLWLLFGDKASLSFLV